MRQGEEYKLETAMIKAFREKGCLCYHADMLSDGFPDLLVLYKDKYCLIELKHTDALEPELSSLVETSQPPMWYTLASKAKPAFLIVEKENGLWLFGTDFKNVENYLEPTLEALPFYGVYDSCVEVVRCILPTLV